MVFGSYGAGMGTAADGLREGVFRYLQNEQPSTYPLRFTRRLSTPSSHLATWKDLVEEKK